MTAARPLRVASTSDATLREFQRHMETAKLSPATIDKRLELLARLVVFLRGVDLLDASPSELEAFQESFANLSRNSIDIYSRHVLAFYKWATHTERLAADPTRRMVRTKARKGVPHPISEADLRMVLACSRGGLRLAYILAAFAGLRCGEICRLRVEDLTLDVAQPTALIHGKGGHERVVPLLQPVIVELRDLAPRRGLLVTHPDGRPWASSNLSIASNKFMHSVGVESTLHSLRHYFATQVVRLTKDILLTRDLLGHQSVATTQVYMQSSIDGAQERLAGLSAAATSLINNAASPTA